MERVSLDRYTGCLLGGAIGDALGAPVEFNGLERIRSRFGALGVTDYVEFPGNMGAFTDDTQMTLFTAEGLLRAAHRAMLRGIGGALQKIVYDSYRRWLYTQDHPFSAVAADAGMKDQGEGWLLKQEALYRRRAPGITCQDALKSGEMGEINNPINESKGCGTIMRVAPVGLMFFGQNEYAFETACELSVITHGNPTGYLSAGFFASVISDLAVGEDLEVCVRNARNILLQKDQHEEILEAVDRALDLYHSVAGSESKPGPEMIEMMGEGWVAEEALAISLFTSLVHKDGYRAGVLLAVNHGGDSDSTGSITGNILGLINGAEAIPEKWRKNLRHADLVREVAEDIFIQMKGSTFHRDEEWWEKYPGY